MKYAAKILALVTVGLATSASFAAPGKAPLRVDFNQMIEQGAQDGRQISQGLADANATNDAQVADTAKATPKRQARGSVIDFIDMEVGVGDDAHVVDRR